MTLTQLKDAIINEVLSDDFLVLLCEEDHYLAMHYVKEILETKNLKLNIIDKLEDSNEGSLGLLLEESNSNKLNVLITDVFKENKANYYNYKNTIVICNKIDKSIGTKMDPFIVKMVKLTEWAVLDYLKMCYAGVSVDIIDYLYKITNGDAYKMNSELNKTLSFDIKDRDTIFKQLLAANRNEYYTKNIFDIKNALLKKDTYTLLDFFCHLDCDIADPIVITNLLLTEYKRNLLLRFNSKTTCEDLGITKQQAYFVKNSCGSMTELELKDKIKFLSQIDYRLKNGELELDKDQFITYIVSHLMA